jgi:hypothetical protein
MILRAAALVIAPLTAGGCTRAHESSWSGATIIALFALVVSVVSLLFSLYSSHREHQSRLVLDQTGDSTTDVIVEWPGVTTYQLSVLAVNASPTATIVIREYCVKLPWQDESFTLLEDPTLLVPERDRYKFPRTDIDHPRGNVVNHKRNGDGVLRPGSVVQGLLLAWSADPVPAGYRHQKEVRVEVGISDETGKSYRHPFTMWMNLARKQTAQL